MSRTEHHIGKIQPIAIGKEQCERFSEDYLKDIGKEKDNYYSTFTEQLCDDMYDDFFYHKKGDTLYRIIEDKDFDDDDIIEASENPDGTISFQLKFYNGGASMGECLEEAMDKL